MIAVRTGKQGTTARRISWIQDMSMALAAFVILLSIFLMFTAAQAKGRNGGMGGGRGADGSEGNLTSLGITTLGGSNHGVQVRGAGGIGGGGNSDSGGHRGGGGIAISGGGTNRSLDRKLDSLNTNSSQLSTSLSSLLSTTQSETAAIQFAEGLFCNMQSNIFQ